MNWIVYFLWINRLYRFFILCFMISANGWGQGQLPEAAPAAQSLKKEGTNSPSAGESGGSLMLSEAELEAIGLPGYISPGAALGQLRLDGIIYHSEEDWVIWVNGDMYSADNLPTRFTVTIVTPHYIEIQSGKEPQKKGQRIAINQSVTL